MSNITISGFTVNGGDTYTFPKGKFINIMEADPTINQTGSQDNYAKIQTLFSNADNGDIFFLPAGTYLINQRLLLSPNACTIMGVGMFSGTTINAPNGFLNANGTSGFNLYNLTINGGVQDYAVIRNTAYWTNIEQVNFGEGYGIVLNGCRYANINGVIHTGNKDSEIADIYLRSENAKNSVYTSINNCVINLRTNNSQYLTVNSTRMNIVVSDTFHYGGSGFNLLTNCYVDRVINNSSTIPDVWNAFSVYIPTWPAWIHGFDHAMKGYGLT